MNIVRKQMTFEHLELKARIFPYIAFFRIGTNANTFFLIRNWYEPDVNSSAQRV